MADTTAILQVDLTSNTSDADLLRNLQVTKTRGLPTITIEDGRSQPLILCGSGPSIQRYFPAVRAMYPHAPIMAVNGAYQWLLSQGIVADYYAQLDARDCNLNFVVGWRPQTLALLASQVHPNIFDAITAAGGQIEVFHLNCPSAKEVFPDEKLYCGAGGGTIGTTALLLGALKGFRQVLLLGYDSSYEEGKSHVIGQPQNDEYKTIPIFFGGREYRTTYMMAKQVEQFRPYLAGLTRICPTLDVRLFGEGLLYDYLVTGQNSTPTRESEAMKYSQMYEDPLYAMSPFRQDFVQKWLAQNPGGGLLDVGTGRGEVLKIADELGYSPVNGTETVPYLCGERVTMALLPDLPVLDRSYDTVTCFEVVEHLLPEDVVPSLRELLRVSNKRIVLSVCTAPDVRFGIDLHPSARSQEAWEETFREAFGDAATFRLIGNVSTIGVSPVYEVTRC